LEPAAEGPALKVTGAVTVAGAGAGAGAGARMGASSAFRLCGRINDGPGFAGRCCTGRNNIGTALTDSCCCWDATVLDGPETEREPKAE